MVRFLSDEHISRSVVRGLRRHHPDVDIVRVQDVGLRTAGDQALLAWAASEDRLLITFDGRTMPKYAYERVRAGQPMPGVVIVSRELSFRTVIADLAILALGSEPGAWEGQVLYLPL